MQLLGADGEAKRLVAPAPSRPHAGRSLYRLPADALPQQAADQETFVRLWQRESMLLPIALYIDAAQTGSRVPCADAALQRLFVARRPA